MEMIYHIIGRTIQTYESSGEITEQGPKELKEYEIKQSAQILLNGEPAKIADLRRGDSVRIGSGRQDGFYAIEALRSTENVVPNTTDLSHPKVLVLEHEETTGHAPVVPTPPPVDLPPSPEKPTTPSTPPVTKK